MESLIDKSQLFLIPLTHLHWPCILALYKHTTNRHAYFSSKRLIRIFSQSKLFFVFMHSLQLLSFNFVAFSLSVNMVLYDLSSLQQPNISLTDLFYLYLPSLSMMIKFIKLVYPHTPGSEDKYFYLCLL